MKAFVVLAAVVAVAVANPLPLVQLIVNVDATNSNAPPVDNVIAPPVIEDSLPGPGPIVVPPPSLPIFVPKPIVVRPPVFPVIPAPVPPVSEPLPVELPEAVLPVIVPEPVVLPEPVIPQAPQVVPHPVIKN